MSPSDPQHVVAVVGGAVSGSVAAEILADHGVEVVVLEQNARPYGKIEDGLPRWHVHQRRKEYERIDARLRKEGVHFVPRTKLGEDVSWEELTQGWGLSAVLLANGAWRDRPFLGGERDALVGKGLVYQNPLIYWFNHKNEQSYDGPQYEIPDGTIVFGGGLASIDVLKVCQLEVYGRALEERGLEAPMLEMEKKGIPAVCERQGIDPQELGVSGTLLLYRRRKQDMPLAQPVPNATPEQMAKTLAARAKLLEIAQRKYLFRIQDKTLPLDLAIEGDRVRGVKTVRTEVEGRKATPIEGSEETLECELVISSIGSVPEKIPGINMKGETYTFSDWDLGIYEGAEGVFGVGNVVTGQGNIRASLLHSKKVTQFLTENYLGGATGAAAAAAVEKHLEARAPLPPEKVEELRERVRKLQERVSYSGYDAWISQVTPSDLE
ncbi:MAG: NAD(P)-binding protein [Planctomycetota bacterium]|nr:NAD(P)-binding protein [Planctomycetota bacterium]